MRKPGQSGGLRGIEQARMPKSDFRLWLEGVPQVAIVTVMCATLGGFGLLFGAWLFVAILRFVGGLV